jgi:hypothetical protein
MSSSTASVAQAGAGASGSAGAVEMPTPYPIEVTVAPVPVIGLIGGCVSSTTGEAHRALVSALQGVTSSTNSNYTVNNAASSISYSSSNNNAAAAAAAANSRLWWRRKLVAPAARVVQFVHIEDEALATSNVVRRKAGCPRASYDTYTCHGVLRGAWLARHAFDVPCVLVMFTRWPALVEADLTRRVDAARVACRSRQIKLALVLLHDNPVAADADSERFAALRKQADVDKDLMLHLHVPDLRPGLDQASLATLSARLDKWVAEQGFGYYHEYARALKKPKQSLHKQTQQRLLIRLSLKIGFLAEFRADAPAALKYYAQAYAAAGEWRAALAARVRAPVPVNAAQLLDDSAGGETLSDIVAKEALRDDEAAAIALLAAVFVARCHLASGRADLAALAIRKEAAAIRATPLPPNREFIGWSRLAALHIVFTDLLEQFEATPPSDAFSAVDLCHTAFHYGTAARLTESRRRFALAALKQAPVLTADKPHARVRALIESDAHVRHGELWITPEQLYVGQPAPIMSGGGSGGPLMSGDAVMLRWAHLRALLHEHNFAQHRRIALLMLARQYKSLRPSRRLKRAVALQLAERHNRLGEHVKARNYADEAAYDYRAESWWALLAAAVREAMRAVKAQAEFGAWLSYAAELLPACMQGDRAGTQRQLCAALADPTSQGFAALEAPVAPRIHYSSALRLVDVRVAFEEASVRALAPVRVRVRICSLAPLPLRLTRVAVQFNEARFDQELRDDGALTDVPTTPPSGASVLETDMTVPGAQYDLVFWPEKPRVFVFSFTAPQTPTELECLHVILQLGALPNALSLRWSVLEWRLALKQLAADKRAALLNVSPPFVERASLSVLDHAPQATLVLDCLPQALQGGLHALRVVVTSALAAATTSPQLCISYRVADATAAGGSAGDGAAVSGDAAAAASAAAAAATAAIAAVSDDDPLVDLLAPPGMRLFADERGTEPLAWHSAMCSEIAANGVCERTVYLLCPEPLARGTVSASVTYTAASGFTATCSAQTSLPVIEPLAASLLFFSTALAPLTSTALPPTGELWVCVAATSRATVPVHIDDVHLVGRAPLRVLGRAVHAPAATAATGSDEIDALGALLQPGGEHCSWFRVSFDGNVVRDDATVEGLLSCDVDWRRSSKAGERAVRWRSARFRVATESDEFETVVMCAPVARVGEVLPHTVLVRNCTTLIQTFSLVVESDVFAFAGDKFTSFRLLPGASRAIDHALIPLRAGRHALPNVQLTSQRQNRDISVTKQKRLIFVEQARSRERIRIEPHHADGSD